jgi:predicted solute-binding protein
LLLRADLAVPVVVLKPIVPFELGPFFLKGKESAAMTSTTTTIEERLLRIIEPFGLEDPESIVEYLVSILQEESLDRALKTEVLQEYLSDLIPVR